MADFRAITSCCEAVVNLLKSSCRPELFGTNTLDFRVGIQGSKPLTSGVSLSLYRIYPNSSNRIPAGRVNSDGSRQKTRLPIDLHLLLTAWGEYPSLQFTIAGWMMRVLEDTPILSAGLLNSVGNDVFKQDEEVEINIVDLTNDDLFRIWEKLTTLPYQISVPYVARNLRIESNQQIPDAELVTERIFR
jgi:hypothetical protein